MNTKSETGCTNLIIQPYPIDTLANIANVMDFFKESYEVDNPDFNMSDESRQGFYILLAMVQQAAEFEVMRLEEETEATQARFSHDPIPRQTYDELRGLFDRMLDNTENSTEDSDENKPH